MKRENLKGISGRRSGTTDASKKYEKEDIADFGAARPFPVKSGGARISDAKLLHGSTPTTSDIRRVIFPWHTGIQPDHETLEIPGQHTWSEVSNLHRDLLPPSQGVNGQKLTHSVPPFRFPASVMMESSSPLCDALIERRRWTDPEVVLERDILLGADDAAAKRYVSSTRERLIANYLNGISKLEKLEGAMFAANSVFLNNGVHPARDTGDFCEPDLCDDEAEVDQD
jgi:hypothetical protein